MCTQVFGNAQNTVMFDDATSRIFLGNNYRMCTLAARWHHVSSLSFVLFLKIDKINTVIMIT